MTSTIRPRTIRIDLDTVRVYRNKCEYRPMNRARSSLAVSGSLRACARGSESLPLTVRPFGRTSLLTSGDMMADFAASYRSKDGEILDEIVWRH